MVTCVMSAEYDTDRYRPLRGIPNRSCCPGEFPWQWIRIMPARASGGIFEPKTSRFTVNGNKHN